MTLHTMIDLETLGTKHNAVILSLGAVKFDPWKLGVIEDRFYVTVDAASCQAHGLTIDARTVMWWFDKDRDAARASLLESERVDLGTALEGFAMWFGEPMPVWSSGAAFDNTILCNAYKAIGLQCPWQFWHNRCYRTLKAFAPELKVGAAYGVLRHHALEDATTQALQLQGIIASLGVMV